MAGLETGTRGRTRRSDEAILQAMRPVHFQLVFSGRVQGVRYRKSAVEQAARLGITGYAMNLPDGTVLIEAEGDRDALIAFVAWCRSGPPLAVVDRVDLTEGPPIGYHAFVTRR